MINPIKGEVAFEAGGQRYVLLLDFNVLIAIEQELGVKAPDLSDFIGKPMDPVTFRTLFRVALNELQPDLTDHDAGRLITAVGGVQAALSLIAQALVAAWTPADAEGEVNGSRPRKAQARAGTG